MGKPSSLKEFFSHKKQGPGMHTLTGERLGLETRLASSPSSCRVLPQPSPAEVALTWIRTEDPSPAEMDVLKKMTFPRALKRGECQMQAHHQHPTAAPSKFTEQEHFFCRPGSAGFGAPGGLEGNQAQWSVISHQAKLKTCAAVFSHSREMDVSRLYQCHQVTLFSVRNELLH